MDALSSALQNALNNGLIKGVEVESIGQQGLHSFYADDVSLIFRDEPLYLQIIMNIFYKFGKASGLYVNWAKTKAAYIFADPLPARLGQLGWTWETDQNASKLLGFPVAQSI
jgi:hypothetical protein